MYTMGMTTNGTIMKSSDSMIRKQVTKSISSQEGDTAEESSASDDDDISYGSDHSSIIGDEDDGIKQEILWTLTEDETLFSDEEVFSEEEDVYDLGSPDVETYTAYDYFETEPPHEFDEYLYTIDEEGYGYEQDDEEERYGHSHDFSRREVFSSSCDPDEPLSTIREEGVDLQPNPDEGRIRKHENLAWIEKVETSLFHYDQETDFFKREHQDIDADRELCTSSSTSPYFSYYRSCAREAPPITFYECERVLFTILEEPELEDLCKTEESNPPRNPESLSRTSVGSIASPHVCNFDGEESLPDIDTLISNLEASLAEENEFLLSECRTSTVTTSGSISCCSGSESIKSQRISRPRPLFAECRHDALVECEKSYPLFGISFLNLEKNIAFR
jgi:hypothetical protein